ncbi:FecR family protein [Chryseolinea lacunae]|uniref:FecR domain-containing protein n=1 Tax=Chryseolinea lacunae TaxID=2801331 RepID=A0ABS1KQZ7_9BACT|nr:FecR domain-containing protein [Chryseolinea lacunae]MBL0741112.1 FecR domain-containing protein [Chryseolinea lacunae]
MNYYKDYSVEALALDKSFQEWVLNPDAQSDQIWQEWLRQNPDKQHDVAQAMELVRLSGLSADAEANAAYLEGWSKVMEAANADARPSRGKWVAYASLAAALVGLLVLVYVYRFAGNAVTEFKTAYAEVKEIELKDGTRVMLNANSTLTYNDNWDDAATREVTLKGEGFFTVVHTADDKPFVVHAQNEATILVLGTEFNVSTRRNKVAVYLQSGKVRFNTALQEVTMKPGESIEYIPGRTEVELKPGTEETVAWTNKQYVMSDTPLADVVRDLEDTYGKPVMVSDTTLLAKRVTAKVPANNLNVLLEVLSQTLKLNIEDQNNKIVIRQ